ncbi:MAG: choline dehydrogenase [Actinomycetia bacterium]|nr:choline dehydrogenase [Actinomycetes bacterium]
MAEYDDVIVGGGSAGIALATRLTEDEGRRVLLLEAGPDHPVIDADDSLADQMRFSTTLTHWGTDATFVPGGMRMNYPQGRRMGGGSGVNGAFAVRGITDDYARWAAAGGDDWAWPHVQRALDRLESDPLHGTDGPVPIARWTDDELLPVQHSFRAAVTGHGIPWVEDLNAPGASGIGVMPMNRRDGQRMSTALTYLPLARDRENLTMRTGAEVTRVVIEGGRAVGVEVGGEVVRGERIILCSGALQSPTLLMRSGIGPAKHLADVGVDCLVDLPGVGGNLRDHQGVGVFMLPRGDLAPAGDRVCQLAARYSSSAGTSVDDMWLSCWGSWELDGFPDMAAVLGVPAVSTFVVGVHDPLSTGSVRLRSTDPQVRPEVDFNMLSDPVDVERLVEGLQLAIELAIGPDFADAYSGIGLLDPSAAGDRATLEGYIRSTVGGWYHPTGTCRMGRDPDDGAVVDGRLQVHGVDALHVVDASIMPTIVRAPTNLSSIAIGERAAELLR